MKKLRQRGAALLAAMLTVTLVATFAAAALWQQWRSVEVEAAERWRQQSDWLLTGALDWARLILREDALAGRNAGQADHLAEPWAVPLQEARLSTFLAADASNNAGGGDPESDAYNVFLSGQIVDQQAFLNVSNLVGAGTVDQEGLRVFGRLFGLLGLPQDQLTRLAENLRFAEDISTDNRSAGRAALSPRRVDDLVWLGVPPETVQALAPYVTLLPTRTRVNLNTAGAEVVFAVGTDIGLADAQRLVAERERQHFRSLQDANRLLTPAQAFVEASAAVGSQFFEIRGRLRKDDVVLEQRSVVRRDGANVLVVQREHAILSEPPPAR